MYEKILKPIFFLFDPVRTHDFFVWAGEMLGRIPAGRRTTETICHFDHPSLHTNVLGVDFQNPIGLGAGFDKDIRLTRIMPAVGFGFMEVGAITHLPYKGNDGRWLVRLPKDKSIIVYYGLKNMGAEAIQKKLQRLKFKIPVGINIAKTNRADIRGEKSVEDYVATYRTLASYFAYATINISCPNAQDGRTFQDPQLLDNLLTALAKEKKQGPILLKLSNDLTLAEIDRILDVVQKYSFIDGFIIGNLSKRRDNLGLVSSPERLALCPEGGISGKPIQKLSTEAIRHIYKKTGGKYTIIGLGGVFTAEDAYEKIKAGASLVQMVTGLIYGGPLAVKRIKKGLVELLRRDGYSNISEAVGKE